RDVLERPGHASLGYLEGWDVGDVAAAQREATAVGMVEAADHVEQRRLARPVGPDHREQVALVDVETHPVDGLHTAEGLGDLTDLEKSAHSGHESQRLRRR